MSGKQARQRINALKIESFTDAEIARRLGLKRPRLELHPVIRVRTHLRIWKLYREHMLGVGPDEPLNV